MTKRELVIQYIKRILCWLAGHRFAPSNASGFLCCSAMPMKCTYCGQEEKDADV